MLAAIAAAFILSFAAHAAQNRSTEATPFATKAQVSVEVRSGPLPLKREEQIAFMFMSAIQNLEDDCRRHAGHACTLQELVNQPKSTDGWPIGKLKFDPVKTDPNYTYKITVDGKNWEAWATPNKPGLGGFYGTGSFTSKVYYNPKGAAAASDQRLTGSSVEGETFSVH